MKKIFKKLSLCICIFIGLLIVCNISKASGGLNLKDLTYDVMLNADGSADIIETWKIDIEDTNTLFKTFEVDTSKYKEITNVEVKEITKNGSVDFTRINEYKYHVDKNCYYALMYKGKFEIAWGAHAEDEIKTYKISYKVIDAIKNYSDCSEFYWQFISTESEIPADFVHGTIKLPQKVLNNEDLRVWAHGPLNGNINKVSNDTINFEVKNLEENTMLEVRCITPNSAFYLNQNKENKQTLKSILEEEQRWADEANEQREIIRRKKENTKLAIKIIIITTNIIGLVIAIIVIKKIKKYKEELSNAPVIEKTQKLKYYRDIPNENATPAEAGFLYYFKGTGLQFNIPKIISATMLDLCMKKYIEFEILENKKDQIKVILVKDSSNDLSNDEKIVYEILQKVANKETNSFTMKEFEKYSRKHASKLLEKFREIENVTKEQQEKEGNYSSKLINTYNKWIEKAVGFIFLSIFSIFIMWLLIIPAIVATVYCFKIASRYNTLTKKGEEEKNKWIGLKTYMEEFSMIEDKTVPELVLWEKYLVYATAFGIADKVLKQLKVVYPQIEDANNLAGYSYMHLMYSSSLNSSFLNTLNDSLNTSYQNMNYSSRKWFRRRIFIRWRLRRRRRPEWEEDNLPCFAIVKN